jgi:peptidoglycan/LPS O-acetylase OafA/YrhL
MFWLWTFLIYWLLLFVACYIVTEVGQNHFYDEVTPFAWLKVGGSSLLLAAALAWWNPSSVDLFTSEIWLLAMVAVAGFVLFVVVMQFHASHAIMLGPAVAVLVSITAAMTIDSLENSGRARFRDRPVPPSERVIRKSASSTVDLIPEEPSEEPSEEAGESKDAAPGATSAP